jgi:type IV pilus assembly protein PilY1
VVTGVECELPLYTQQGNIDANVVILFDNSGSMNEAMFHDDYDPNITYTGNFTTNSRYYINASDWYTPNDFNANWPASPSAFLVVSDNGESGRYDGNYLNWVYFHATEQQRLSMPLWTRTQVAKIVVSNFILSTEGVRFGLATFNAADGAVIAAECGIDKASLITAIWTIGSDAWTPLGEAMEDILDYFTQTGADAPIQAHCQHNFLILMTDGLPTMDLDVSTYLHDADQDGHDPGDCQTIGSPYPLFNLCSDHMDDVAYYMYQNDLRADLGDPGESGPDGQNIVTYTIGFGIDAYLLQETADNGGGLYFTADSASELAASLQAIMQDIISRISAGGSVAVVSSDQSNDNYLYRGKFMPGTWRGYLEAFAIPYVEGAQPVWEAGALLAARNPQDRTIFTGLGSTPYIFDVGSAGDLSNALNVQLLNPADIIRWVRGNDVQGYRDREGWVLGDIINSTPKLVGPPCSFYPEQDYQEFLTYYSNRPTMIYVGANDGMVHAFYAENGSEAWAFVPEFALPRLQYLVYPDYCHLYTCDQTVAVSDVKIGGVWRTVLLGGGRGGGAGYYALDVTEPPSFELLWQVEVPNRQPFGSEVEFARIGDTFVALIGSGLEAGISKASLYAYNLETGQHLGTANLSTVSGPRNKASKPRAVDIDLDGRTDVVYCADFSGHVWRLQTNDSPYPSSWDVTALFAGDMPISAPPVPAFGENNEIYVYFGTGVYLEDTDLATTDQNSFYCVFDSHDGNSHGRYDLVDQTSVIHDIGNADGWYIDLIQDPAERVTEPAVVAAGAVLFTSYAPNCEPCMGGGRSWLYRMSYDDGSAIQNDDPQADPYARIEEIGEGIAAQPVVDINNGEVIVQTSDAGITVEQLGPTFFHLTVRSWQENYDFVEEPANNPPNVP